MKIDWKQVAQSSGYKTIKAKYTEAVQNAAKSIARGNEPIRDKSELLKQFKFIIGRAQHYAHYQKRPIEEVLLDWVSVRQYCWLNQYQDSQQPKLGTRPKTWHKYPSIKRMRVKAKRNQLHHRNHSSFTSSIRQDIIDKSKSESTKKKPRWTTTYKKSKYR